MGLGIVFLPDVARTIVCERYHVHMVYNWKKKRKKKSDADINTIM